MRPQVLLLLFLSLSIRTFSQCEPIPYRRATSLKTIHGTLKISVRPHEFNMNSLLCLAADFEKQHPEWRDLLSSSSTLRITPRNTLVTVSKMFRVTDGRRTCM